MNKIERINSIINEPVHGRKFYTQEHLDLLKRKLFDISNSLNIDKLSKAEIIMLISNYVKNNVEYKKDYFDYFNGKCDEFNYDKLIYRTAYGALVCGQAMCAGYAESLRVLLSLYDVDSYTLLSKLPLDRKRLLHYVVVTSVNKDSDKYYVLDPQSEQYCNKNNMDYEEYKENSIYMLPNEIFTENVIGIDGAGMLAEDYIKNEEIPRVVGTKDIKVLIKQLKK